jgi:hypothetical protein
VSEGRRPEFASLFGEEDPFNDFWRRFSAVRGRAVHSASAASARLNVDVDGSIITNNHVERTFRRSSKLSDDDKVSQMVGRDSDDIAVIKSTPR